MLSFRCFQFMLSNLLTPFYIVLLNGFVSINTIPSPAQDGTIALRINEATLVAKLTSYLADCSVLPWTEVGMTLPCSSAKVGRIQPPHHPNLSCNSISALPILPRLFQKLNPTLFLRQNQIDIPRLPLRLRGYIPF